MITDWPILDSQVFNPDELGPFSTKVSIRRALSAPQMVNKSIQRKNRFRGNEIHKFQLDETAPHRLTSASNLILQKRSLDSLILGLRQIRAGDGKLFFRQINPLINWKWHYFKVQVCGYDDFSNIIEEDIPLDGSATIYNG